MGVFRRLINQAGFNPLNKTFRPTFRNSTLPTNNSYTLLIVITIYSKQSVLDLSYVRCVGTAMVLDSLSHQSCQAEELFDKLELRWASFFSPLPSLIWDLVLK